ncbi:septum site-determining protein Ssd [Streptomyces sp. Ru87]|uniref:septum site-determining protein Ssd n=1 Tax=Streptomyces sp. Ru87 TaxID=2044307 RepID=UPI000BF6B112|nr:septum site-determining protein Ssd [Streptomyces sp. Ru87]PGH49606.1 septum formation initiator [Streptomyces sp. Ru87]
MNGSIASDRPEITRPRGVPLVVTEDEALLDDLLRLCAAAGAEAEVCSGTPERGGGWELAPLVLVGADAAHRARGAGRRQGVLLVSRGPDDPGVWRAAVSVGADHVVMLPDAEAWLVDRIADAAEGAGRQALTVGVIGGRGGAGASTLACALAVGAARSGTRTMLIDADPLGGGLDVLLGGERTEGLRWPAFARSRGRLAGGALEESLPELRSLRVLSWDRGDSVHIPAEAARAVLSAARRRGGVVVVDLPRRVDETAGEALAQLDLGLLVVPGELRAVAAAHRVVTAVTPLLRDLRAVVRGPCEAGLDEREVSRLLGLPLAGELPPEPGLAPGRAAGAVPGASGRGPLARFSSAFWDAALAHDGSVAA